MPQKLCYGKVVFMCDLDKLTSSLPQVLLISISEWTYKYIRENRHVSAPKNSSRYLWILPIQELELNDFSLKESELLPKNRLWKGESNHVRLGEAGRRAYQVVKLSLRRGLSHSHYVTLMWWMGWEGHTTLCSPSPNPKPSPRQEKTSEKLESWRLPCSHVLLWLCLFWQVNHGY